MEAGAAVPLCCHLRETQHLCAALAGVPASLQIVLSLQPPNGASSVHLSPAGISVMFQTAGLYPSVCCGSAAAGRSIPWCPLEEIRLFPPGFCARLLQAGAGGSDVPLGVVSMQISKQICVSGRPRDFTLVCIASFPGGGWICSCWQPLACAKVCLVSDMRAERARTLVESDCSIHTWALHICLLCQH